MDKNNQHIKHSIQIDGKSLYFSFLAGANKLLQNQAEINRINIFPVNDKDTGTNLAATVRCVLDNIKLQDSYKSVISDIAESALVGSRGNSGLIFAQFLYGINCNTANKSSITLSDFIKSIQGSIKYIYQAISNPVEGTILTVINEWSKYLESNKNSTKIFEEALINSFPILEQSLSETTNKLKVLKESGVVDAGAKGFVLFINGIIDLIKNGDIPKFDYDSLSNIEILNNPHINENAIEFRYCSEAILKDVDIELHSLKEKLRNLGDSIVVAGSNKICRVHIHTNCPVVLFQELSKHGTINFQKVDDMIHQQEITNNRKWNIALVTDSSCDLDQKLIDYYQINVVPLNISFGQNQFLDKITINPDKFYEMIGKAKEFPKTSQINESTFNNLYSHLASCYDEIIAIHLTSNFSGTFNNSRKSASLISKEFNKPIYVIDSRNLSGALGLLVLKAAKCIENGETAVEIVHKINIDILRTKIFVSVKNLRYMIRGGRVSKHKSIIAQLIGYHPVVSMDEQGKSMLFGNTFSQSSSLKKIINYIKELTHNETIWNYIILHAHNPNFAIKAEEKMIKISGKKSISFVDISPVIGMHAGIGAVAISILFNN